MCAMWTSRKLNAKCGNRQLSRTLEPSQKTMPEYSTLAAVDLGSNSFRLQVARVVGEQIYPLDSLREMVRLAAGLTADKQLDEDSQARALACLECFGERLRGFSPHAVRVVGTNSLRVAKNASAFLKKAEAALGFPIEVIAGREEARLIYLGVAHGLPISNNNRLVVDIGGGSTEFIIGNRLQPIKLESLYIGCVSHSLRFFPDGKITKNSMKQAELAARHLVGGRARGVKNEILYRFEFPDRPGALMKFLDSMNHHWNISLFHYRNHGADYGRVLVGMEVPPTEKAEFKVFLDQLGYSYWDESKNPAYKLFLG